VPLRPSSRARTYTKISKALSYIHYTKLHYRRNLSKLDKLLNEIKMGKKTRSQSGPVTMTEIGELLLCLRDDLDERINSIVTDIEKIKNDQERTQNLFQRSIQELTKKCEQQAIQISKLEKASEKEQKEQMKTTIIIRGMNTRGKDTKQVAEMTNDLIKNKLLVPNIKMHRCRQMGPQTDEKPNSIMVEFTSVADKMQVLKNSRNLKGTEIKISPWMTKEEQTVNNHVLMERRNFIRQKKTVRLYSNRFLIVSDGNSANEEYFENDGAVLKKLTSIPKFLKE